MQCLVVHAVKHMVFKQLLRLVSQGLTTSVFENSVQMLVVHVVKHMSCLTIIAACFIRFDRKYF